MGVCWMFLILLGCRLSGVTQAFNTPMCNGEPQVFCRPNKEVRVPCPYVEGQIIIFDLLRNQTVTSSINCLQKNQTWNCTQSDTQVIMHQTNTSVSFILTNFSRGIYKCHSNRQFPPPLKTVQSEEIEIRESQCRNNASVANPQQEFLWIWIVVFSVLVIYGVTATIIALVYWKKLKKVDSQSDYMNTKPRAPRFAKKRGIHNPIPRYF